MKSAIYSVIFTAISNGVFADHTVVNNLQCTRDAGVITTSWVVVDSSQRYGGDLVVEAAFVARCTDELKSGKVNLNIHLSQDTTEIYSYQCDGSKDGISLCTGKADEQDIDAAVTAAIAPAAEALCKDAQQSLISVTDGKTITEVSVRHIQKGEKVDAHCHDS